MRKSLKSICMMAGTILCLAACSSQAGAPAESTPVPAAESKVETETSKTEETQKEAAAEIITLIHVNDIHGYVEETETNIGYAKIAGYIAGMKEAKQNVLAIDAGDTFAGNATASFDQGESIAGIVRTVPFDVMVLGNNDFFLGREQLLKLTDTLDYPSLAGNVTSVAGEAPWSDYTILTTDSGLKIGFVTGTCGVHADLEFQDPIERLKEQVAEVRPQADIVIGLLHMGYEDSSGNTSQLVAQEVEGIDLIIDGHSHTVLESGAVVNGVLIAQTGEYGNHIGVIELSVKDKVFEHAAAKLLSYEDLADQTEKADTKLAVDELAAKSGEYFAQEVGETTVELTAARELVRTQETNLGNMAADAVREANGTDVAFAIAGGIGGEIVPGSITKRDILSIGRVNSNFAIYEMTGADIIEALELKCSEYPEPSGNFLQVSGISFVLDAGKEAGERIGEVVVGGEPLDPDKVYTVSGNEGLAKEPGFANGTLVSVNPTVFQDIVEQYIVEHSPVSPEVEGRIVIKGAE